MPATQEEDEEEKSDEDDFDGAVSDYDGGFDDDEKLQRGLRSKLPRPQLRCVWGGALTRVCSVSAGR